MPNLQRTVVLLVEDDDQTRELYRSALQISGFSVMAAADGITALRVIERHQPDALVIDLGLPLMSGTALIEELHVSQSTRGIPVIVVTGIRVDPVPGATSTLTKPIDPYTLVLEVQRVLRGKR